MTHNDLALMLRERCNRGISSTRSSIQPEDTAMSLQYSTEAHNRTHHIVAPVHLGGDAAKKWAARSGLVKIHVGIGEALLDYVHDLRHDVANVTVLLSKLVLTSSARFEPLT
jgi:hypothetical protein